MVQFASYFSSYIWPYCLIHKGFKPFIHKRAYCFALGLNSGFKVRDKNIFEGIFSSTSGEKLVSLPFSGIKNIFWRRKEYTDKGDLNYEQRLGLYLN